jgi:hypothetical protein
MADPFDSPGQAAPRPFAVSAERGGVAPVDRAYPPPEAAAADPMGRHAAEWGLASLVSGAALMITGAVMLVFNLIFWNTGPKVLDNADMHLALMTALIGVPGMVGLCGASLYTGVRAIQSAATRRQPAGLPLAGTLISAGGLMMWLITGADLLMILFTFAR